MNKISYFLLLAAALACANMAYAQSSFHDTVVSYFVEHGPLATSDCWFAAPANYEDGNTTGKYIRIYITAPNNTTAFVHYGNTTKAVPVPSLGVATYNIPDTMEMESSGIVENKAIHVWDPTDDISVYFMSHAPYSSDGTYVLQTSEWGRDYVVAGFASLLVCGITTYGDIPCSFTIAADQDNTRIEITPSCDLRQALIFPLNGGVTAFPKGKKFNVILNRGQSIQLESVDGETVTSYDITGTIIHSNYPVGVIGASECTNIPSCYDYCDFVCHANLPVSSWGKTYYSTPFIQPDSMPLHDSSMFLVVSSKDSQIIHRYDCASDDHIECRIDTALHIKWIEEAKASKWYSDAPFMLVQYMNSSDYPDGVNGWGDPSEVALEPKENYSNSCLFIVADSVAPQAHNDNYANIFYNDNAAKSTLLDGKSILGYTSTCIGDSMSIAVIPHISPGAHYVKSDSGVSVYVYGYGYDESYSWSGGLGARPYVPYTHNDSIAPAILFAQNGNCIHATIADSGSGLADIVLDSSLNMSFAVDSAFVPSAGAAHSFADLCDSGLSQFAYVQFSVFDLVGNVSIATVTVTPKNIVTQEARTEVHATLTPNPAAKSAILNFTLPQTADVTFELLSIDGKTVLSWKADVESAREHVQSIDLASLPQGSYIYRFEASGQVLSGKLIINR
jgi:hypothetical protein